MTIIGALPTFLLCIVAVAFPRRFAALVLIIGALFITQAQAINIGGFNMWAVRILEIVTFSRVLLRGELAMLRFNSVDRLLVIFFSTYVVFGIFRTGILDSYSLGTAIDAWLVYFTFRALVVGSEEVARFLKGVVVLLVPFAFLMSVEFVSGYNWFSLMGGVPETPVLREGHYRCQGSFNIAITAGSIGATFIPVFASFAFQKPSKRWALIGIVSCAVIVFTSRSSGPLMAAFAAVASWVCWFFRRNMQWVRRGIVIALGVLQLTMVQPVWFIFDRISGFIGGDGWHRANLIDQFIKHFPQWWLVGMNPEDTGDWAATKMPWGGVDVTNYYISIGLGGGLISLVLFLALLTKCFAMVGSALRLARTNGSDGSHSELVLWGAGAALAAHAVNVLAVMYWDQSYVIWYLHLALAVGLSDYYAERHGPIAGSCDESVSRSVMPSIQNA